MSDDRSEERSIHFSIIQTLRTVSTVKPLDSKQFMIDISDNDDFNSISFKLPANNENGNNEKSTRILNDIESYVYLYYPYGVDSEVTAIFTRPDNTEFELPLNGVTILNAEFTTIVIINKDTQSPAVVFAIYS